MCGILGILSDPPVPSTTGLPPGVALCAIPRRVVRVLKRRVRVSYRQPAPVLGPA